MPRRDQRLARDAAKLLAGLTDYTKEVRTRLVGLPTLLHRSGLVATFAIITERAQKSSSPVTSAYVAVQDLLIEQIVRSGVEGADSLKGLSPTETIEWLSKLDGQDYARVSAHISDAVLWVKRLSEARRVDGQG